MIYQPAFFLCTQFNLSTSRSKSIIRSHKCVSPVWKSNFRATNMSYALNLINNEKCIFYINNDIGYSKLSYLSFSHCPLLPLLCLSFFCLFLPCWKLDIELHKRSTGDVTFYHWMPFLCFLSQDKVATIQ